MLTKKPHRHHFTKYWLRNGTVSHVYGCQCGTVYGKTYKGWITKDYAFTPVRPDPWEMAARLPTSVVILMSICLGVIIVELARRIVC
jgi:hypothetical protein